MMLYYIYSVVSWPWYYIYIIIYIIFHDVTISLQLSVVDPFPRVTGQELRPCPRRCCSLTGFYGGPPAAVLLLLLSFLLLPLSSLLVVTVHRPVLVNRPISLLILLVYSQFLLFVPPDLLMFVDSSNETLSIPKGSCFI